MSRSYCSTCEKNYLIVTPNVCVGCKKEEDSCICCRKCGEKP